MGQKIIQPGQQQPMDPNQVLGMLSKQLNSVIMEINLLNVRLQVVQNVLIAKKVLDTNELEAEWNKIMEEAKKLQAKSKLVTPDGTAIPPAPETTTTNGNATDASNAPSAEPKQGAEGTTSGSPEGTTSGSPEGTTSGSPKVETPTKTGKA